MDESRHSPCECAVDCHAPVSWAKQKSANDQIGHGFTIKTYGYQGVFMGILSYFNVVYGDVPTNREDN